jgi:hypothetical protein
MTGSVDAGSRKENALKKRLEPGSDSIRAERALGLNKLRSNPF